MSRETFERLQRQFKELQLQHDALLGYCTSIDKGIRKGVNGKPRASRPPGRIYEFGKITHIYAEDNVARINMGRAMSIYPGQQFEVCRQGRVLCFLVIDKVFPNESTGNFIPAHMAKQLKGDVDGLTLRSK